MATFDLPYCNSELCLRMDFIEPFGKTEWDVVPASVLEDLLRFLRENWSDFQRLIIHERAHVHAGAFLSREIYLGLKMYTRWFDSVNHIVEETIESTVAHIRRKAELARHIAEEIEFHWTHIIKENCPIISEVLNAPTELLTADERLKLAKESKDEETRSTEDREIMSFIKGTSLSERMKNFQVIQTCFDGLGGVNLAKYIQAAIELGLLSSRPPFKLMQKYWNVTGQHSAVSKYYSQSADTKFNPEDIEAVKGDFLSKLDS